MATRIEVISVESEFQQGLQQIHVLLPDDYNDGDKYAVLYVMPVEIEFRNRNGYGLGLLEEMNAHNIYNLIIVQPGFAQEPWAGDHVSDKKIRQASYITEYIVPYIDNTYSTFARASDRYLFGFSKGGWAAFSLIFRNPHLFGYAAAWDAPMIFDQCQFDMVSVYGSSEQLQKFRPDLQARKNKNEFQNRCRLVLMGENYFGKLISTPDGNQHTTVMHQILIDEKIRHHFDGDINFDHCWKSDWAKPLLNALMFLPLGTVG